MTTTTTDALRQLVALIHQAQLEDAADRRAEAAERASSKLTTAEVIEDVDFLVSVGESAPRICRRVGRSAAALERLLLRHDRPDLARHFSATTKADRKKATP